MLLDLIKSLLHVLVDYYQVLFDDGIKLKKKSNQIFKLKPVTRNIARSSGTAPVAAPSQTAMKLARPLPELTPISHLISSATSKSQISPAMVGPPPPLVPKPKAKPVRSSLKASAGNLSTLADNEP